MAEEHFTLATFYNSWHEYQDRIRAAIAPLTDEQLALRAAPNLRTIGENAAHIVGCRAGWFTYVLGEDGGPELKDFETWDRPGAAARTAAELAHAMGHSWRFMADCIGRWSDADMRATFPDEVDGKQVFLSRAWVVWHVLEHDLHHGGEISLTLGMHGLQAPDI